MLVSLVCLCHSFALLIRPYISKQALSQPNVPFYHRVVETLTLCLALNVRQIKETMNINKTTATTTMTSTAATTNLHLKFRCNGYKKWNSKHVILIKKVGNGWQHGQMKSFARGQHLFHKGPMQSPLFTMLSSYYTQAPCFFQLYH